MLDHLLSLIAPHECLVCGEEGSLLCRGCDGTLPAIPERCYRCRAVSPDSMTCARCRLSSPLACVQAATEYTQTAKDLVWKLKFNHARAAAKPMARLLRGRIVFDAATVLVHVPTANARVRQRGYDQAELMCVEVARLTGLSQGHFLARHGSSRQVGASRKERVRHLASAFRVRAPETVRGKHVVLVDDVLTTGATLETAARALKKAGAKRVDAIVFAQA